MESILMDYLNSLKGKKIAVIGMGVSNTPLVKRMLQAGLNVRVCDKRERADFEGLPELEAKGLRVSLGENYLDGVEGADVIFRTPGVRPDVPQIAKAVAQGAKLTSEMEAFLELCPCSVIAVTGSDGKTTTTTIIAGLLKAAGYRTFVGGNIGHPLLCEVDEIRPDDMVVLELSSFQLMTMHQSPNIAVITNLSPNHLDVHKDMQEYVEAKKNIFRYQDETGVLIVNGDNAITAPFRGKGKTRFFTRQGHTDNGATLEDGWICRDGEKVLDTRDILLPGVHNIENYMAAILAVEGLVSDENIRQVAKTFGGVEHRIELVAVKNGVKYYNDSIASSPSRTIAGLESFSQKVLLIAGGYDKHIPYDVLGPVICAHVKKLYLNGATAEKIRQAVVQAPQYREGSPEIAMCGDLYRAVEAASREAQPGDVVLLSPASAGFDQFKNFMERGNVFKKLVKEL